MWAKLQVVLKKILISRHRIISWLRWGDLRNVKKKLLAAGLFKYVGPFSGHQAQKGYIAQ